METDEFTAAAPPDPDASGAGETSFADAEAPPASERAAAEDVEHDLDALVARAKERDEYLALAQRTQADFENYRKRAAKDAAAAGERAKAGLVRELLPVVDNLERALASAPEGDPLLDGVKLVHGELVAVLERSGVKGFDPQGETFDPTEHEALSTRPAEDGDSGVVLDVVEKGYRLNGAILRPARVIVSA
jgi:molecular chaperone GrpE